MQFPALILYFIHLEENIKNMPSLLWRKPPNKIIVVSCLIWNGSYSKPHIFLDSRFKVEAPMHMEQVHGLIENPINII